MISVTSDEEDAILHPGPAEISSAKVEQAAASTKVIPFIIIVIYSIMYIWILYIVHAWLDNVISHAIIYHAQPLQTGARKVLDLEDDEPVRDSAPGKRRKNVEEPVISIKKEK